MRRLARVAAAAGLLLSSLPCPAAGDAAQLALGKRLFTQQATPPCAVCHTLKDAGSQGTVGPVLDDLKPDAQRVLSALRNGIGVMPSFAATLSEEQMLALAAYVATASAGN